LQFLKFKILKFLQSLIFLIIELRFKEAASSARGEKVHLAALDFLKKWWPFWNEACKAV